MRVATPAGRLLARWVIHTVGPIYSSREDRAARLVSCHVESLRVADELGCAAVAFPAISTGVETHVPDRGPAAVQSPADRMLSP